ELMPQYISFKPEDDHPQFACPSCLKPFSPKSTPLNLGCGHIECDQCRHKRIQQRDFNSLCCNVKSSHSAANLTLLDLAKRINSSFILASVRSADHTFKCESCNIYQTDSQVLTCVSCSKFPLCYPCLFENHNGHGWIERGGDVHADFRNNHKSVDHTLFADRRVLNVNGEEFIVSATLMSVHSSFFDNLFSSSPPTLDPISLDADPKVFSDILDMIYPWKMNGSIYHRRSDCINAYWDYVDDERPFVKTAQILSRIDSI
ncbi:hypothetical protein PFISCL1PPCAC_14936, partial [Pristionchus fissidentatus]